MNCSDFEKKIYLYQELTPTERKMMDEHTAQCSSCYASASVVQHHQQMMEKIKLVKPTIKDPERLVQKIMNSLETKSNQVDFISKMTLFFDHLFVRYAFTTFSVVLITFFFVEQREPNSLPVVKVEAAKGVVLNTNSFLELHLKNRRNKQPALSISKYSHLRSDRVEKTL